PRGSRGRRQSALPAARSAAGSARRASRGTTCRRSHRTRRSARTCPGPRAPPGATRAASPSRVAPLRRMDGLELERLRVQQRRLPDAGELPRGNIAEPLVVAPRLTLRRLILLPEVAAAGLVALQRVAAHELRELEEVGHAARLLERLVEILAPAADVDVVPELLAQHADLLDRVLQAGGVAGHAAAVPHEATQLAVERVHAATPVDLEELARAVGDLGPRLADRGVRRVQLGQLRLRQVVADRVREDEIAVGEPLHQ